MNGDGFKEKNSWRYLWGQTTKYLLRLLCSSLQIMENDWRFSNREWILRFAIKKIRLEDGRGQVKTSQRDQDRAELMNERARWFHFSRYNITCLYFIQIWEITEFPSQFSSSYFCPEFSHTHIRIKFNSLLLYYTRHLVCCLMLFGIYGITLVQFPSIPQAQQALTMQTKVPFS